MKSLYHRLSLCMILLISITFILQGCSSHSQENSINEFWGWFSTEFATEQSTKMTLKENSQASAEKISRRLKLVNKDLLWQFGPVIENKQQIIISAGGDKKLFPLVKQMVEQAPRMDYWTVSGFRPRVGKLKTVEIDGIAVSPEDIFFTMQPRDSVVDICILLDNTIPHETAEKVAVKMLDQALGEYDAATKVGKVTFGAINENNEDDYNFQELGKEVDQYLK